MGSVGLRGARRPRRLKPAGHSATIEALIQPAIVIASTLMSAIAAYVLAYDEIARLLADRGSWQDGFVIVLCVGMGFLIDMAIIVSATRYKMHAVRADPREQRWLTLAKWVLIIGLTSETMTLFYFFVRLDPAAYPSWLVWLAGLIHAFLVSARAFLPPVVVAYFAAGVLPVSFDRADRNREIKTRTSSNVMTLIDRLSYVEDTDDKAEMLQALGGQLVLDTYATYDETARTTEDEQLQRDAKLLAHMARMHNLDWSQLGAHVAPELVTTPRRLDAAFTSSTSSQSQQAGRDAMGAEAGPTRHLPPNFRPAYQTPQKPLSIREQRRQALIASMDPEGFGQRGHPTSPRERATYDDAIDVDEFDAPGELGEFDRFGGADDYGAYDDDTPAAIKRPAMHQRTGARRDRAQAARMQSSARELVVAEPRLKTPIERGDSEERRRVLRFLDKHPSASIADVMAGAKVTKATARQHRSVWQERQKQLGQQVATATMEMPVVLPQVDLSADVPVDMTDAVSVDA